MRLVLICGAHVKLLYAAKNSKGYEKMPLNKEFQHIAIGGNSRIAIWIIKQIASITMHHLWFIKQSTMYVETLFTKCIEGMASLVCCT